ncbi:phosphoenolpyruvate--protein phosphotransferase [Lamprobacter modestohalophilus]|uniref:phosphoenolpyruvate--protein phosphotransferase n=1 Tax=Lamprobacter modestohalophilus TaxID=1064514 RepID=UPI002ADEEEE8|nr:phosphoenolpyruvate--protein phosphotransferase [Lamprobacter modestohalophilus]MEA1050187.1 phosphoenolpyruvate--protein phosphotransferase [Lamprobacter modestohalophilus]
MTAALLGVGVCGSRPVAIGRAQLFAREPTVVTEEIDPAQIEAEVARLDAALECARHHLESVRGQIPNSTPLHIAEFIDAHLLMLTDSALVDATRDLIRERSINAGWALQIQRDTLVEVFDAMGDAYLRTRRDDVDHVVRQIQVFLSGEPSAQSISASDLKDRVIVADDLTPADTILLRHRGICAFVIEHGGPMSHTAILARSLDIPAVLGVHNATHLLRQDELLVVNAESGTVLAGADESILAHYRKRLVSADQRRHRLRELVREPSTSRDGVPVVLLANLELPEDVDAVRSSGASGVGLYRTEFLYMNRSGLPDEEEHLETYLGVMRGLDGIPLTIRTLDLGMDKQVDGLAGSSGSLTNPALGLRAIRLCLREPGLFVPQLRAILRASAHGPVRLMLPMISAIAEVETVLGMIAETRRTLRRQGLPFDPLMPVGAMIEVPAAALCAGGIAKRVDFLSIGTNDLIQYTLAIDRVDDSVNYLYDPLHPAVLRLIRITLSRAAESRTRVSMCGEMAGDPRYTAILLGLGLREMSMQPASLLEVKEVVRSCDVGRVSNRMDQLMDRLDDLTSAQLLEAVNEVAND